MVDNSDYNGDYGAADYNFINKSLVDNDKHVSNNPYKRPSTSSRSRSSSMADSMFKTGKIALITLISSINHHNLVIR